MTKLQLLDCYRQFSNFNSNIEMSEIVKLQSDVNCESEATTEAKYKCLGKETTSSDFCYDKYTNAEITDLEIEECIKNSVIESKFDKVISGQGMSISSLEAGLVSPEYYKSSEYQRLLIAINTEKELQGSMQCYLKLATFFNMVTDLIHHKKAAQVALNDAFSCLIKEGVPFYGAGCDLKYQLEIDINGNQDGGYYKSDCMSGTTNYYYP